MRVDEWARCVALWRAVWPNHPLPAASTETWFALLADLPDGVVHDALMAWANDPDLGWPPRSPGELRAAAQPDDDWVEALGELRRLIARCGGVYADPVPTPDNPALARVVDGWGWQALCNLEPGNTTARAQFRDAYRDAKRRTLRERAPALGSGVLPAVEEGSDAARG